MTPSVLIVHNRYRTRGGEEKQVDQQARLLREKGHDVFSYEVDSQEFFGRSLMQKCADTVQMPFSIRHYQGIRKAIQTKRPGVVHVHNVFPFLTPSVYYAAAAASIPVVQSVHNYRFMCSNGLFMLPDGSLCERCRTGSHWNAVRNGCYGGTRLRSLGMTATLTLHRTLGTMQKKIHAYVMTSKFLMQKLTSAGFSQERMTLLPPLFEPVGKRQMEQDANTLLYVGRLSHEKGLNTLLRAACQLPGWTIYIVGSGPLEEELRREISDKALVHVRLLGKVPFDQLQQLLQRATFLVVPSECYENLPTVFLEAWSYGLPVIASRLGGMAEAIQEEINGFLFEPGNAAALATLVRSLSLEKSRAMRKTVDQRFQQCYSSDLHYKQLMKVYQSVLT